MIALDGSSSIWVIGMLSFLLGTVIGCILTYTIVARNNRTHQLQVELNELTGDFRDYRDQVTNHFMRTSELVQEMTQSYRSVYEHLASGAQHLCGENELAALHHAATAHVTDDSVQTATVDNDVEYDELEELARIRNDIDELLGESPRVPDIDAKIGKDQTLQH